MFIVVEVKILWGIAIIAVMMTVVLLKELVLCALTHFVSAYLGLSQLFNLMKTTCLWELLVKHFWLANSLFSEYIYLKERNLCQKLFVRKKSVNDNCYLSKISRIYLNELANTLIFHGIYFC